MYRSSNWRRTTGERETRSRSAATWTSPIPQDDHTIGTANADLQWIRDTLDLMPNEANVVHAWGQMAGDVYTPLAAVALQRQFFAYNQFAGRLRRDLSRLRYGFNLKVERSRAGLSAAETPIEWWTPRGWFTGYGFGGSLAGDRMATAARTAAEASSRLRIPSHRAIRFRIFLRLRHV